MMIHDKTRSFKLYLRNYEQTQWHRCMFFSSSCRLSCDQCNFKTSHHSSLTIHIRSHTGYRPFICGMCGELTFLSRRTIVSFIPTGCSFLNVWIKKCTFSFHFYTEETSFTVCKTDQYQFTFILTLLLPPNYKKILHKP